jgi:hypothetical protein
LFHWPIYASDPGSTNSALGYNPRTHTSRSSHPHTTPSTPTTLTTTPSRWQHLCAGADIWPDIPDNPDTRTTSRRSRTTGCSSRTTGCTSCTAGYSGRCAYESVRARKRFLGQTSRTNRTRGQLAVVAAQLVVAATVCVFNCMTALYSVVCRSLVSPSTNFHRFAFRHCPGRRPHPRARSVRHDGWHHAAATAGPPHARRRGDAHRDAPIAPLSPLVVQVVT